MSEAGQSSLWFNKTLTQQSIDESDSMIESIMSRRSRRRLTDSVSSPPAIADVEDTSEIDEMPVFRATDSPELAAKTGATNPAPSLGRPRQLSFSPMPQDGASGTTSPHALARTPTPSSSAASRRLSLVEQEQFRNQLRQRATRAQTKAQGRAQRRSRVDIATRFDRLHEGSASVARQLDQYMINRRTTQAYPSAQDGYDFFCRVFPKEAADVDQDLSEQKSTAQAEKQQEVSDTTDSRTLLTVYDSVAHAPLLTQCQEPPLFHSETRQSRLRQILTVFDTKQLDIQQRVPPGVEVIDPADDGLYVPARDSRDSAAAPDKWRHHRSLGKLQHRATSCHTARSMEWFGVDGQMVDIGECLANADSRPLFVPLSHSFLTHHLPPQLCAPADVIITSTSLSSNNDHSLAAVAAESTAAEPTSCRQLKYQLHLQLDRLQLLQHSSLSSREHDKAASLQQLVEAHNAMERDNEVHRLTQRLWTVRQARDNATVSSQQQQQQQHQHEARLSQYDALISQLRQQRDNAASEQRKLCRQILRRWRELKGLRETQGYTSSSVRLIIHQHRPKQQQQQQSNKDIIIPSSSSLLSSSVVASAAQPGDVSDDAELLWQREIIAELSETAELHQRQYHALLADYHDQLAAWKRLRAELKSAEHDEQRLSADQLRQRLGQRPRPPAEFDREMCRHQIEIRAANSRGPPGEPQLSFELAFTQPITDTNLCPKREQQRRAAVLRTCVSVRVLIGRREVSRTKPRPLDSQLSAAPQGMFAVRLRQSPDNVRLVMYVAPCPGVAAFTATCTLLATLNLSPPASHVSEHVARAAWSSFSSQADRGGAAPQMPPSPSASNQRSSKHLLASGRLLTCMFWGRDESGALLAPPPIPSSTVGGLEPNEGDVMCDQWLEAGVDNKISNVRGGTTALAMSEHPALGSTASAIDGDLDEEHVEEHQSLYAVIPSASINTTLAAKETSDDVIPADDVITSWQQRLVAVGDDLSASWRCRLLRLRAAGVAEFRHMAPAPLNERLVPRQLFTMYETRMRAESCVVPSSSTPRGTGEAAWRLDGHVDVLRCRAQTKDAVVRHFANTQRHKRLEDVVREDQVPVIGAIGSMFGSLLSERRPLNPTRQEPTQRTLSDLQSGDVRLVCHVVRAFNVPVRRDSSATANILPDSHSLLSSDVKMGAVGSVSTSGASAVRPFVEVTFQRNSARTCAADGANPTWNEQISLPVRLGSVHDSIASYSGGNSNSVMPACLSHCVHLSLRDEQVVDLEVDDRRRSSTVHQRRDSRWLAALNVPFSTLYLNQRVEGTFCLSAPPLLAGYKYESGAPGTSYHLSQLGLTNNNTVTNTTPTPATTSGATTAARPGTYLTVFITLEPALRVPALLQNSVCVGESDSVLAHCQTWLADYKTRFPHRWTVRCCVMTSGGEATLVTRYLRPIKPPDSLLAGVNSVDDQSVMLARFVALIPNVSDVEFFSGMYDLWLTSQQFLDVSVGDEEEHATLLCNFFLYLGKRAYLVLGHGIPEGRTAYVLTVESVIGGWLWNACTGERTRVSDNFSRLQRVDALVNEHNVWANTQTYSHPAGMRFDTNIVRDWRPLFARHFPRPVDVTSLQEAGLRYHQPDVNDVTIAAETLERKLRDKFQAWRQKISWTQWNRSCTEALRAMLPHLEQARCSSLPSSAQLDELQNKLLANIHASYKVSGVPLNSGYVGVDALSESIFALGVHDNRGADTEFALAVHMHPYPSRVVSVWVYVACLTRIH